MQTPLWCTELPTDLRYPELPTYLHEVVSFPSDAFVLSHSKVGEHVGVADVRRVAVAVNVHSPITEENVRIRNRCSSAQGEKHGAL